MNGGKDIKFGHDKRPITIVEKSQENLFNIKNGEILTDEFGTPLLTEVDTFFLKDATAERSTSVVFPTGKSSSYVETEHKVVGIHTANYGLDRGINITVPFSVNTVLSGTVSAGSSVTKVDGTHSDYTNFTEVNTVEDSSRGERNRLYFPSSTGILNYAGVKAHDTVSGVGIPDGTFVTEVFKKFIVLSNNTVGVSNVNKKVEIRRATPTIKTANHRFKIQESFRETSEVSSTLLGINRAEVQLSLFSNVSSYGIDKNDFEYYSINSGGDFSSWTTRSNKVYGSRYNARQSEEVQESAVRLEAFPTPYSYPFGPKFQRLGQYNEELFNAYKAFIQLGNDLYDYFDTGTGASLGYPSDWKEQFLDKSKVYVSGGDVEYAAGISESFALVDTWTDVWRDIKDSLLADPVTGDVFNFPRVNTLIGGTADATTTRPGYSESNKRFTFLQSRRVFRYQPGRISGFTFGLRSSVEPVSGVELEWGISNPTDQYVFQIDRGQLSIIRRSTVPLSSDVLERNGLQITDQREILSGNPADSEKYWTIKIPRDNFNGDPLNGNGPSGYLIQPENVTMYKIEFGWYGAIGARFYVYIPSGNGESRWVAIHTLVLENSLGVPCLQDSYFRLNYSLNVFNTGDIRTPQFLYKYGSSYYIDGGDEGTSQIFSATSKEKTIIPTANRTLIGITPKNFITNSAGDDIVNKKLIIPSVASFISDSLMRVEVIACTACPGFAHVYTPGIASTESGRQIEMEFTSGNNVTAINDSVFYPTDVGAKIIAPTIFNAYISEIDLDSEIGNSGTYENAVIKGYGGLTGYPNYSATRPLAGIEVRNHTTGITTTVGITTYPDTIRLSNYDAYAVSDYKITGSEIDIQFVNPTQSDVGHFSDILVGLTNVEPITSIPSQLDGFTIAGVTTTRLPNENILFAEYTHSHAAINEDGVETGETYYLDTRRLEINNRIPRLSSPAGGACSRVKFTVLDPNRILRVNEISGNPETNVADGNFYLQVEGLFPSGIDFDGGQVAVEINGVPTVTGSSYVGSPQSYIFDGDTFSYIQINQSLSIGNPNFTVLIRPIRMEANGNPIRQKLYNYVPYPLYLVFKLKDNAALNNISLKEKIGDDQITITPKLYTLGNIEVTNAGGNADINATPPTNFKSDNRLSSALIDIQNEQTLRPGILRDTIFVGANDTKVVDMGKIFGYDRNVITPDNDNLEATFFVAKKIDPGASGTVEATVTFKEQ
jgi:hypothetical protein